MDLRQHRHHARQLKSMGLAIDWSREIATCDPSYYKHQQRMFLDFLEGRLVDRKTAKVNWDPVDQTVLANEQVIDGRGWRSGALVEQRELTQWFFKITDHAQDLVDKLDTLERWPDKVRLMQRNWIGRSEGLLVRFALDPATTPNGRGRARDLHDAARTRCSARSSWRSRPTTRSRKRRRAGSEGRRLHRGSEAHRHGAGGDREGREAGLRHRHPALHPFDPSWQLPVYVANFILMEYGTGAIFGCPAHDQRDLDFVNNTASATRP